MQETTIKDLCTSFPKTANKQSPLENVATKIFNPNIGAPYIQSSRDPELRYKIPLSIVASSHHNRIVEDFDNYGPNEQFLINKILFTPAHLLLIIGGIGVGKTTFTHFFLGEVLSKTDTQNESIQKYGACSIYFDFLDCGNRIPVSDNSSTIRESFIDALCTRVLAELDNRFFDLEDEVGTVWQSLIEEYASSYQKPDAIAYIMTEIRKEEAENKHLAKDYEATIAKRKDIRKKIDGDSDRRLSYVQLLLRYVREEYFQSSRAGLLLFIDNVDREPSLTQAEVLRTLKTFARTSGGRTIMTMRQTTYYQQYDDGLSEPVDIVPYCGPMPLEIVNTRLGNFLKDHQTYSEFYEPALLPNLVKGIRSLKNRYLSNDSFSNLFKCLCGHSVRKGLLLGQRLVDNSVYDPASYRTGHDTFIGLGDVLRATLVGTEDIFHTSPGNIVNNVFQVGDNYKRAHLIKLRILRQISAAEDEGIRVGRVIEIMTGFNYPRPTICSAINEMKSPSKRLIWSDSVRGEFADEKALNDFRNTRLYMSTAGRSYFESLYSNIDYVQEVMLDTKVHPEHFRKGWKYDRLEDRFTLLLEFLTYLSSREADEVEHFVSNVFCAKDYVAVFKSSELLTKKMYIDIKDRVDKILTAVADGARNNKRREELIEFRTGQLALYENRIIMLENFEYRIFENSKSRDR